MTSSGSNSERLFSSLERKVEIDISKQSKQNGNGFAFMAHEDGHKETSKTALPKSVNQMARSNSDYHVTNSSRPKSGKQSIKRLREQRRHQSMMSVRHAKVEDSRKRARKSEAMLQNQPGNIVAPADDVKVSSKPDDFYWEMEAVVGKRLHRGRVEYLIRWKGCSEDENTWEPASNLCDTAMEEAIKFVKEQKRKERQIEEDEEKLFSDFDTTMSKTTKQRDNMNVAKMVINDNEVYDIDEEIDDSDIFTNGGAVQVDTFWNWTDVDAVIFQEVERIHINDPHAAKIVKDARVNGTPVVLIGHVGWANFATRWLSKISDQKKNEKIQQEKLESITLGHKENPILLDSFDENNIDNKEVNIATLTGNGCQTMSDCKIEEKISENSVASMFQSNFEPISKETGCPTGMISVDATKNGTAIKAPTNDEKVSSVNLIQKDSTQSPKENGSARNECSNSLKEKKSNMEYLSNGSRTLLDLSQQDYYLDIDKMINDVGEEDVPVIKRHYNEEKPIHGRIRAAKFLTNCWPSMHSEIESTKNSKNSSNLYLHQWQFPLSDIAGRKLCHQNNPLPKAIMGEDLLKYWIDLPQCKLDSPFQYIFMGREDTLSKLHKDPGGLEISIAPIVGEKECVLVHRSDGSNCLYHLTASLDDIDLHRYPLLSQARIWRTTIKPGEILLMPHGTYHQCRNLTPCLSYSRFHLDTVNLLPFAQSLVNGDAPEIDHEEILWNLTSELINKIDYVVDATQLRVKKGQNLNENLSEDVIERVNILRTLRHFVREVARRHEIRKVVKGDDDKTGTNLDFGTLVDDVDMCLHEFRYRKMINIPPFKPRRGKALKNTLSRGGRKDVIKTDLTKFGIGGKPVVAFNASLEVNYMSLKDADVEKHYPHAAKEKVGEKLIHELSLGDLVIVKLEQKVVKAEVLEISPHMSSVYLSFEDYPSIYDEYQPSALVRLPNGEEIPPGDLKPGLTVIDISNSNEYRAMIQSIANGPMAKVSLFVSQHEMTRWICPNMILGRYIPKKQKQTKIEKRDSVPQALEVTNNVEPTVLRPFRTGQIVDVHRKGAAWVIKCYLDNSHEVQCGELIPTHVDIRFILNTAMEEYMVPIELVRLAPELDPDSGRCLRHSPSKRNYLDT